MLIADKIICFLSNWHLLVLKHTSVWLQGLVTYVNFGRYDEKYEQKRVVILQLNTSFWMPHWFNNKSLNGLNTDRCKTFTKLDRQFRCFAFLTKSTDFGFNDMPENNQNVLISHSSGLFIKIFHSDFYWECSLFN